MLDDRVRAVLRRLEEETEREDEPRPARSTSARSRSRRRAARSSSRSAAGRPGCEVLEIGGSRGYSTIWLGAAVRDARRPRHLARGEPGEARGVGAEHRRRRPRGVDRGRSPATPSRASSGSTARSTSSSSTPGRTTTRRSSSSSAGAVEPGAIVVADNVVSHRELAAYSAARQADPEPRQRHRAARQRPRGDHRS